MASKQRAEAPSSRVIVLFDEIEAHLHPRWQRLIVPALLKVVQTLTEDASARVQLVAATHSPLVLASVEPSFDDEKDAWFDLDFSKGRVALQRRDFIRRGEVDAWLTSDAFDLKEPRSIEAETAISEAMKLALQPSPSKQDIERVDQLLRASLGEIDRFWVRWTAFRQEHGVQNGKASKA
jgi:hypothetical protein